MVINPIVGVYIPIITIPSLKVRWVYPQHRELRKTRSHMYIMYIRSMQDRRIHQKGISYCWWFINPSNQLRLVVNFPLFIGFLAPSKRWLGMGFQPSTVSSYHPHPFMFTYWILGFRGRGSKCWSTSINVDQYCWCFRNPIPNHRLDGAKNPVNNGINYQPQLVSRIASINSVSHWSSNARPHSLV